MSDYLPLPKTNERIKGQRYMHKNEIVIWGGKYYYVNMVN